MLLLPAHYAWRFFKAFEIGWLWNARATRFDLWGSNNQTARCRIHYFLSASFLSFSFFFLFHYHNSLQGRRTTATLTSTLRMRTVRLTSSPGGTWTSKTHCSFSAATAKANGQSGWQWGYVSSGSHDRGPLGNNLLLPGDNNNNNILFYNGQSHCLYLRGVVAH